MKGEQVGGAAVGVYWPIWAVVGVARANCCWMEEYAGLNLTTEPPISTRPVGKGVRDGLARGQVVLLTFVGCVWGFAVEPVF